MQAGSGTTRLIGQVNEEALKKDLENYRQQAMELGASQAEVIPAQWVEVDERVRLKCLIGRCLVYGQCAYCPPHVPEPEFMRKAFSRYQWAIILKNDVVPAEDFADGTRYRSEAKHEKNTVEIVNKIESLAFADGYYLAMGFGCGSCRRTLCSGLSCQVLEGGQCRFPLRARPSMEAAGIDVFSLVTRIGWEVYPIYRTVNPCLVPSAVSVGIVFIH